MGTRVELHVFGVGDADALANARAAVEAVDDALTIHRPSPATALNERLATGQSAAIDAPILLAALAEVDPLVALTGGLFDPAADVARTGGWASITLDATAARISTTRPLALDFGGFGKGYALDRAVAVLRDAGVVSAFLSAGESSIAVVGRHPLDVRWPVGIPDPTMPDSFLVELELEDEALSISSTIGAHADAPGRSPTVRPHTGEVVATPRTAIAVERSGARAEAMSTALLIADDAERARLIGDERDRRFVFGHTISSTDIKDLRRHGRHGI
ncbi:FAD:protein FMN transferase [Sphingomonas sp. SUN019]|uniref:FAD:protein FMN transferase n=1 Tax=Sphingomonas sp. SUN019 TaxID=2937788 RepID=UPI002164DBBA|nr:FAD:protein FMN transferase [Sphingomonas sp. SUN019]UVO49691.1 FAD:protein FMN transferase [Sphingomonas sp. SUN019]